jgi:hypothetical protein
MPTEPAGRAHNCASPASPAARCRTTRCVRFTTLQPAQPYVDVAHRRTCKDYSRILCLWVELRFELAPGKETFIRSPPPVRRPRNRSISGFNAANPRYKPRLYRRQRSLRHTRNLFQRQSLHGSAAPVPRGSSVSSFSRTSATSARSSRKPELLPAVKGPSVATSNPRPSSVRIAHLVQRSHGPLAREIDH